MAVTAELDSGEVEGKSDPGKGKRKRKRLGGKTLRDAFVPAIFRFARSRRLPESFVAWAVRGLVQMGALAHHVPLETLRSSTRNMASLALRPGDQPYEIFRGFLEAAGVAATTYLRLERGGVEAILPRIGYSPGSFENLSAITSKHGGGFMVVPHSHVGVLALAKITRDLPFTLLYRGPPDAHRDRIQRRFLEGLGLRFVEVRRMAPTQVAREIVQALRRGDLVAGATDINRRNEGSIPAKIFGEDVDLPGWPARYAAKRGLPVSAGTAIVSPAGRIVLHTEPLQFHDDAAASTQAWATALERIVRGWPTDWLGMFEKRWRPVIARAAARAPISVPDCIP